jgi:hypothetical protein
VQKLKSTPKGLTLGVKVEIEKKKKLFNLPQVLINAETFKALLVLAPKLKKRIPSSFWEADVQPLGPICNPKMLKVGPKFLLALTPSVKRAFLDNNKRWVPKV